MTAEKKNKKFNPEKKIAIKMKTKHAIMAFFIFGTDSYKLVDLVKNSFDGPSKEFLLELLASEEDVEILGNLEDEITKKVGHYWDFVEDFVNQIPLTIDDNAVDVIRNGTNKEIHIGCQVFTPLELERLYGYYFMDKNVDSIQYMGVKVTREKADRLMEFCGIF